MNSTGGSTGDSSSDPAREDERFHVDVDLPLGPLLVVADGTAIVGLYHGQHDPPPGPAVLGERVDGSVGIPDGRPGPAGRPWHAVPDTTAALLIRACTELTEYFRGVRREFEVPVDLHGTPFQRRVWAALTQIPYGERRSYGDVAAQLGNPRMGRAIGAAVRANPVAIIVPGHRIVSTAGAVVGYAAGPGTKTALLDLEAAGTSGRPGAHG